MCAKPIHKLDSLNLPQRDKMAGIICKGTFGHMQKSKTQTSCRASDASSDQGLNFWTLIKSMVLITWLPKEIMQFIN